MHVCVVLGILLIAQYGICNFLEALMQVLLLVDHVPSSVHNRVIVLVLLRK